MEIRKADAKGRVTGFTPWRYYQFRGDPRSEVALIAIYDVDAAMPAPVPEKAQDYLRRHGLDPMRVLRDEANELGYWEVEIGQDGRRVFRYGASVKTRKPWPEGFNWDEYLDLALLDLKET